MRQTERGHPEAKRQESRTLKLFGLSLIGGSLLPLAWLGNQIESRFADFLLQKYNSGIWLFGGYVLSGAAAANALALGLFLALAGVRRLSLQNPRTRRGLRVKMAGANCLAAGLAAAGLVDSGLPDLWAAVFGILCIGLGSLGIGTLRKGFKYDAVRAEEFLALDPRPPVVYVRSFKDDDTLAVGGWYKWVLMWAPTSFEQDLASVMNRVGPFVAVGKPGEPLPELGASRLYFDDDHWREGVLDLMKRCSLVVIRSGATANLWWEIENAARVVSPEKLVLISLGKERQTKEFEQELKLRLKLPKRIEAPAREQSHFLLRLMRLGSAPRDIGKVMCFDPDWTCHVEGIRQAYSLKAIWKLYTPLALPLENALESVLRRQGVSLRPPGLSRVTAAALAGLAGIVGAHKFYLGEKRAGVKYLVFFWTGAPVLLGLIDSAKLLLMDEAEFQRRYGVPRE